MQGPDPGDERRIIRDGPAPTSCVQIHAHPRVHEGLHRARQAQMTTASLPSHAPAIPRIMQSSLCTRDKGTMTRGFVGWQGKQYSQNGALGTGGAHVRDGKRALHLTSAQDEEEGSSRRRSTDVPA
jgi:hypothetical protein